MSGTCLDGVAEGKVRIHQGFGCVGSCKLPFPSGVPGDSDAPVGGNLNRFSAFPENFFPFQSSEADAAF